MIISCNICGRDTKGNPVILKLITGKRGVGQVNIYYKELCKNCARIVECDIERLKDILGVANA